MLLLRKEVDYEPQSPNKVELTYLDAADGRRTPRTQEGAIGKNGQSPRLHESELAVEDCHRYSDIVRTTDEKKEILGTMLGNVDALVEGVRKAGIWGLS